MGTLDLSFLEIHEIEGAADVLSRAMLNNPLHIAVLGGSGRGERQLIKEMFLDLLQARPGIVLVAKEQGKIIGVMRMISCAGKEPSPEPIASEYDTPAQYRQAVWHNEWAKRDPKPPHWHLGPIGVLPSHRKQGIGSRLMERFCGEVDACGAMAYLETDLDENVEFYIKFGFSLVSTSDIFQVENRYMVRAPRA